MKRKYLLPVIIFAVLTSYCTKTIHDRRSRVTVSPDSREYFGCRVNGGDFVSEASTGNVSGFDLQPAVLLVAAGLRDSSAL